MNVFVVREVDYDEHRLGRCWRTAVCANKEAAGRLVELFTKPRSYHDGLRKFEPWVHREPGSTDSLIGYIGPVPTFVYIEEVKVHE